MMYDVIPITSPMETDCGPTCLKMLLAYYGPDVALETLIDECHVTTIGCTGADVMRVGKAHGLDMVAYNMDADELIHQDRPGIIWWKKFHFCVFCGMNEAGQVVICNPDRGRYPIDAGTFKTLYSGVAFFNGEPGFLPGPVDPDYGERIAALEDELEATKIILGVE